jgi:large subunit ribosomal protein L18
MKKQRKLDKKRRRQGKTNYTKRLILLKGNFQRLVVRKSNKYITLQIVESSHAQDKIISSVNTKELLKQGWPEKKTGSLKSLAASYLGGLLLGKKIKELNPQIILDSGLIPNTVGSRVYSAVKGLSDSGIKINFKKEIVPSEEKIKSNYEFFEEIKNKLISK